MRIPPAAKKRYLPLLLAILALVSSACAGTVKQKEKHWGYAADLGPAYWHTLDPAYRLAAEGKAQSPIDIDTGNLSGGNTLSKPVFHNSPVPFIMENNGHTIQLTPLTEGNAITLDNKNYLLQQLHFHAPGEHRIDGTSFPLELHLVYKNGAADLAVIGILIVPGAENEPLREVFLKLREPAASGKSPVSLEKTLDPAALFAGNRALYRYDGSLTTPPCTEGVTWFLLERRLEMSAAQIDAFRALYSGNNRPPQNLNGRKVYLIGD